MLYSALRRSWLLAVVIPVIAAPATVCLGADGLRAPIGPHACCHAVTAECIRVSGTMACLYPWVEQGNLTYCWGIQACYLPGDECIEIDGICCDDQGGTPGGPGSECPIEACQMPDGTCDDVPPSECTGSGGTPLGAGTVCADLGACCLIDISGMKMLAPPVTDCVITDWWSCYNTLAGFPGRPGTDCSDLSDTGESYPDGMPNVCDNCPDVANDVHLIHAVDCNDDGDLVDPTEDPVDRNGDGEDDWVQCDTDLDGIGNECDNCQDHANGWWAGPHDQLNCDGDEFGDLCDDDIDGDGILNDSDVCDYTPGPVPIPSTGVDIIREEGHPLRGTLLADLDGDCDVDADDLTRLEASYTDVVVCDHANGICYREVECTTCGPCDACCTGFPD